MLQWDTIPFIILSYSLGILIKVKKVPGTKISQWKTKSEYNTVEKGEYISSIPLYVSLRVGIVD